MKDLTLWVIGSLIISSVYNANDKTELALGWAVVALLLSFLAILL